MSMDRSQLILQVDGALAGGDDVERPAKILDEGFSLELVGLKDDADAGGRYAASWAWTAGLGQSVVALLALSWLPWWPRSA